MSFVHRKESLLGYDDLTATTLPTGRTYATPTGERYPSITTVLSILSEEHIAAWKEKVGEEEARKVSFRASNRGTKVHEMIEKYVANDPDYAAGYMPHVVANFMSVKPILDSRLGLIYEQEAALYSHHLGVAGRVDLVGEFDGQLSIVDWKTSAKTKRKSWVENYFIQESAYAIMWEERTGVPITQLVTIIAVDHSKPQVFVEHRDSWSKTLLETIDLFKTRNSL